MYVWYEVLNSLPLWKHHKNFPVSILIIVEQAQHITSFRTISQDNIFHIDLFIDSVNTSEQAL